MNNQHYGLITSIEERFERHDSALLYGIQTDEPDPENTPLFKIIFWSLICVVAVGAVLGWIV